MTRTPVTTDPTASLADLEQDRQRLALAAEDGQPRAAEQLEDVEQKIARVKLDKERAALAEQERQARAQAEAEAREEAKRQEAREKLAALHGERQEAAKALEKATDTLLGAIGRLTAIGKKMYGLSADLGHPRRRLLLNEQLAGYLAWRLGEVAPIIGPRPDHAFRKPLSEILGQEEMPA